MAIFSLHPLGDIYQQNGLTVFFGNRDSKTDKYRETFQQWKFFRLKQIHGNIVHQVDVDSPDMNLEGDSSITTEKNLALCSISADCMPVFIYNPALKMIAGIHSGWRGVAKRVVPATIQKMKGLGADPIQNQYFIGPHIMKASFDVGNDVRDQLLQSAPHLPRNASWEAISDSKSRVDLLQLVESQVREFSPHSNIIKHVFDTKTDQRYHSFRQDQQISGRQVSFICLG